MITHRVTMKSYLRTMQIASLAALLTQCSRQSVPTVPGMNGDIDPTIVGVERRKLLARWPA
jgi:hypothetical protein